MKTQKYKTKNRKTRRGGAGILSTIGIGKTENQTLKIESGTSKPKIPNNLTDINRMVGELETLTKNIKSEIEKLRCE